MSPLRAKFNYYTISTINIYNNLNKSVCEEDKVLSVATRLSQC